MRKLLLMLAIGLLLAPIVSAQEWAGRVTPVYQCNWYSTEGNHFSPTISVYPCTGMPNTPADPYDPTPGYLITPGYITQNNLGSMASPIYYCYNKFLTGTKPVEWGFNIFSTKEACTMGMISTGAGTTENPQMFGYTLKQAAPGTKEVFLCENKKDCCTPNGPAWMYYFVSTDPNCRSDKRPGSTKIASLGFWPQSTSFVYTAPPVPQPEVCCMITNERGDRKANVAQLTQCQEEAKKMGGTYTTSPKEECEKEVCCKSEGRYDWTQYRKCYDRKGTTVEKTREQCKPMCGNQDVEYGEDCENNADCKQNYECKNCQCIEVCPIKPADNDALLAQLSMLEKRNQELKQTKMCGVLERKEGERVEISVCNNLGECVIDARDKGLTLIKTYKQSMCRVR